MTSHPDFDNVIQLMSEHMKPVQREFGYVMSGKSFVANSVSYPNHPEESHRRTRQPRLPGSSSRAR